MCAADVPGAEASGKRTVARSVAPVPGHDRLCHCRRHWAGMLTPSADGPPPFSEGGLGGPDIRTVRWSPPALEEAQQAALSAAVQELPTKSGIVMANWTPRQAQEEGGAAVPL